MEQSVVLNGCVIAYSYDRLSKKCRSCMNKDYCSEKAKEKHGVLTSFQPIRIDPTTESSDFTSAMNRIVAFQKASGVSIEDATNALVRVATVCKEYSGRMNGNGKPI